MADGDVAQRVMEQYPSLRFLLGDPEIGPLLIQAVDPNAGFSPETFRAKLYETNWWRTTPAPKREAQIREATDPATAWLGREKIGGNLLEWSQTLGVAIPQDVRTFITHAQEQAGVDTSDPGQQFALRQQMKAHPEWMQAGGRWAAATQQVYAIARAEYFLPVDWGWATGWAAGLVTGEVDESTLRESLLAHSKTMFPHLSDWIIQGQTPADIINPLRKIAADELEVDMNQIDIGRPEWKMLTGVTNEGRTEGSAAQWRLPTYSEVQKQARSQSTWWETSKGREEDSTKTMNLLQTMGIMG